MYEIWQALSTNRARNSKWTKDGARFNLNSLVNNPGNIRFYCTAHCISCRLPQLRNLSIPAFLRGVYSHFEIGQDSAMAMATIGCQPACSSHV